mgnify:FL=1|jgi:glycosyltransferase involved in cell wall biosynthesis
MLSEYTKNDYLQKTSETKSVLFLSALDLWSMEENKGAPSFYNTVKAFIDDGWNVTFIKPTGGNRKWYSLTGYTRRGFKNNFLERFSSVRIIGSVVRVLNALYLKHKFIRLGAKEIKKNGISLIYAYEVHAVAAGAYLSRSFGIPLVTRFQGTILFGKEPTILNRIRHYPHFSALKQKSDLLIMTDDGTKGDLVLKKLGNNTGRIFFWRNGVSYTPIITEPDAIRRKHRIKDDDIVLLTVSRLVKWKRLDRAILALKAVQDLALGVVLVIVGDGEAADEYMNLARKYHLSERVVFTGAVHREELGSYYAMADIFLSLYDISNVGNPLMEAMLHEKPIITLNNGDTGTVIEHEKTGILIECGSGEQECIDDALRTLIMDPEKQKRISAAAKIYADKHFWTWSKRMQTEISVVSQLIGE